MGHEISGEIAKVGQDVKDFKEGQRVLAFNISLDVTKGHSTSMGIFENGGFAEYVKINKNGVFPLPDSIPSKEATLIETFAVETRALKKSAIEENKKIIIIGGGNIGLCFLKALIIMKNPDYIVVVEPHNFLREKAKEFGASDAITPNKVRIRRFIKKFGEPDYIFDCVGIEDTINISMDLIKRGGKIVLIGIYRGNIALSTLQLISKEICILGSIGHDRDDIFTAIDLFTREKLDANNFVSDVVPLKDIQKAFERFLILGERKFIKILVKI